MINYFIEKDGQQLGPFTKEELKSYKITKTTFVWHEGLNDWTEAKNVTDISDILISLPPPLPNKNARIHKTERIEEHNFPIAVIADQTKYDRRYSKEVDASAVGFLFLAIPLLFIITGGVDLPNEQAYQIFYVLASIATVVVRILATIWVMAIAGRQNRNSTAWGVLAFIVPSIALIIIGQTRKLFDPNEIKKDQGLKRNKYEQFLRDRGL